MASYNLTPGLEWVGYFVGIITITIGVLNIIIGCLDKNWKKEQIIKYRAQAEVQGWTIGGKMPTPDNQNHPQSPLDSSPLPSSMYPLESQGDRNPAPSNAPQNHVMAEPSTHSISTVGTAATAILADEQMRRTILNGALSMTSSTLTTAYDKLFEDE